MKPKDELILKSVVATLLIYLSLIGFYVIRTVENSLFISESDINKYDTQERENIKSELNKGYYPCSVMLEAKSQRCSLNNYIKNQVEGIALMIIVILIAPPVIFISWPIIFIILFATYKLVYQLLYRINLYDKKLDK